MKKFPSSEIIEDIAIELGVDPSFIEKDWFAVQVLTHISTLDIPSIIFTGGTSLSKGYGLIQRFSEDLDFRICTSQNFTRGERKSIRKIILEEVRKIEPLSIIETSILSQNESKFFSFNIEYPQNYNPTNALRPHLKLEFSFEETILPSEKRNIQSFVTQFTDSENYDCNIKTISPVETAANKLSALLWRINIKDRTAKLGSPQNDPTIIRHLHDLAALESFVIDNDNFNNIATISFDKDRGRGGSSKEKSLEHLSLEAIDQLKTDLHYKKEYQRFVDSMSYAPDSEQVGFELALKSFIRIIEQLTHN